MSDTTFDVIVVGGGPGGYVCAIKAAQLGLSVACVEKRETLGGTCLNVGCIPSKALLQSSHHFETAQREFSAHGITATKLTVDLGVMMARKDKVVDDLTKGIAFLFKKNKVAHFIGAGALVSADTVKVAGKDGEKTLKGESIVIATGSDVAQIPGIEIDEKQIVSSTGALALDKTPKSLVVIGGGVIGLELGSVWRRLGAEVTVVEYMDNILPGMDGDLVKQATRTLKKQGMNFKMASKVTSGKKTKSGVILTVEPRDGGTGETVKADVVLLAVGRRPYTEGLGLDTLGVAMDRRGFVTVDGDFQTNVAGVFAIGDVIGGAMLAHKAEEEGVALAEILAGGKGHVNYDAIPGVVYTWPEIASAGKTEEALKEAGVAYKVGKFPFSANSRAKANGDSEGFVKILTDAASDAVLGVHIIGPGAGDIIQEVVVAMEFGGSAEDIARTCHAHPGISEAVKEAAMAAWDKPIHM
ncbi:dihydrolipoyl dehydrogenase [Varunaivibrio sulfuroxidans]|uniref:Dihydrolipoyl dehydrogenase n=1 Tax=Varunaivibrio sulfuroxidans TaxID=1773489 RepID=A0A4R3JCA1_9PROT|nr:dihydrolipoyl dehydrogenase [Varunaivibrio sulfuroxidans]TCS63598.1 dihydrolipoamide dehydrogenase [Varunaivibrio sulfuroxidans]WES30260.1 dihydrolipoyl dehydrogenase [Varunaivibrio sulfuroxidans]